MLDHVNYLHNFHPVIVKCIKFGQLETLGRCKIRTGQCSIKQLYTIIFKRLLLHLIIKRLKELIVHDPVVTISRAVFSLSRTMSPLSGAVGSFRMHVITSVYPYLFHSPTIEINIVFIQFFSFPYSLSRTGKAGGIYFNSIMSGIQIGYKAGSSRQTDLVSSQVNKYRSVPTVDTDSVNRLRL